MIFYSISRAPSLIKEFLQTIPAKTLFPAKSSEKYVELFHRLNLYDY